MVVTDGTNTASTTFTDAAVDVYNESGVYVGSYDTIGEALDAADDGYTLEVSAGIFTGTAQVDESVSLLGANAGVCAGVDSGTRGE